jgi:hypothetical protein
MAFLTVHFDDSGTAPDQQIALAACYAGTPEQWGEFSRNWTEVKKQEGFSAFHMAPFVAGEKPFDNWGDERKRRVLARLCNIITTRARKGFATAITKNDYDEIITGHFRRHCGNFHYTFAVRQICGRVAIWRKTSTPQATMRYVFDWMESELSARREIEYVMDGAMATSELNQERTGFTVLSGYSFERKSSILPLQAADILAWTVYQQMQKLILDRPLRWEAEMAYELLKHSSSCPLDDGYFVRDNLKGWAEAELAVLIENLKAEAITLRGK